MHFTAQAFALLHIQAIGPSTGEKRGSMGLFSDGVTDYGLDGVTAHNRGSVIIGMRLSPYRKNFPLIKAQLMSKVT